MSVENMHDDEIDLAELFYKIWEGRWIVITWTLALMGIMLGYALLRTPIYQIEAVISPTQSSSLIPIQPTPVAVGDVHSVSRLNEIVVYNSTLLQLDSLNVLREFWKHYGNEELGNSEFRSIVRSLTIDPVNPKGEEPQSRRIAINFVNTEQGVDILNSYLAFLNKRVQSQFLKEVRSNLNASLRRIDNNISLLEAAGQENLSYDLLKLKESYGIAKSLNIISTPYKDLENIGLNILDGRDYLLGTDALKLQITTLSARQGKSLRAYDQKISGLFLARTVIASDIARLEQFNDVMPMFKIENEAEASIDPVGAKKSIFMIGGVVAGLFFGCLNVLILNFMRQHAR